MASKSFSRHVTDQHERFVETARKLGADEDEATFKEKLAVIARQKPKDDPGMRSPTKGEKQDG